MAAEAPWQGLLEEAICSICLDFFQNPVLIPKCGHNFCRGCLTRFWEMWESEASCPQCRQAFAPRSLLHNRQLARMAEMARRCGGHPAEEGGSFCPKHWEPLKLFCKDHETLICVVCDRSREHRGHSVIPAEEAFQEYQIKVEDCLKAQKEQKEKIATYKRDTEQRVQEMLDLIKEVKENVVAEFRELQLWLEWQKKLRLTKMEEMEKDIMARKEEGLANHMEELVSLDHLIQEIEEKLQQPASKLLQDIGSTLKKYQAKETYENPVELLLELKWTIWDYSDIPGILKRAMRKWRGPQICRWGLGGRDFHGALRSPALSMSKMLRHHRKLQIGTGGQGDKEGPPRTVKRNGQVRQGRTTILHAGGGGRSSHGGCSKAAAAGTSDAQEEKSEQAV